MPRIPSRLAFPLLPAAVAPVRAIRQGSGDDDIRRFSDVADLTVRNVSGVADGRHTRIPAGTRPYGQQ